VKYTTLQTIQRGRKMIPPGEVVEFAGAEAESLLARGVIAEPTAATAAVRHNAKSTIEIVKKCSDPARLGEIRELELADDEGPRQSVLEAIEKRLDEIEAA